MRALFVLFVTLSLAASPAALAQLVFARGPNNDLALREGTSWRWLGGTLTSAPDACSWGPDRVDVFARGADNTLVQIARTGEEWTSWHDHGGSLSGGPAAVSWGPDRIDVFAVGSERTMLQKSWDGSRWSDWVSLGGEFPAGSSPDAASSGANRIELFARGMDGALWHNAWRGEWSGWSSLGGQITSDPAAVSWGSNRIDVFARGTDGQMWQIAWDGASWSGWVPHGGSFARESGPDASSLGPNRLEVFARGADDALLRKTWNGSQWSEWESLGGLLTSDPGTIAPRGRGVRFLAEAERIVRSYGAHRRGAASVGIVDRSGRIYFLNFGEIEPGVPASQHSVYSIGSVSKVLTGTLVKLIEEDGRSGLALDQPAQQYLPDAIRLPIWYPNPADTSIRTVITTRHLLQHRAGLPRNFAEGEPLDMRLENFVRLFSRVSLLRAPGGDVEYSNIGSELFTAIVEHLDRRRYAESLRIRLTDPLGMTSTAPNLIGHSRLPVQKIGYPEGGGYVQSTTNDMVKFMRAASRPDASPLSGAISRSQTAGLTWFGNILNGAFHHNGKNPAADSANWGLHQSGIMADPVSQMGVVVLTQNLPDDDMRALNIARDIILLARARANNDVFNW